MPFVSVRQLADADFPTRWGHFRILGFEGLTEPRDLNTDPNSRAVENAVALTMGDLREGAHEHRGDDIRHPGPNFLGLSA